MSQKQRTPLKQANSYLIFWAIQGYNEVTTSPTKNLFSIKTNAIINLTAVVKSVYKYGDFSKPDIIEAVNSQFEYIESLILWLRENYNPKIEENLLSTASAMVQYNTTLDKVYFEIIDIIIHLKLIIPQTMELLWKETEDTEYNEL